jgi:hypothetical protein
MTLSQIQTKIYFYTKTNVSGFSNADMIIFINNAVEHIESLITRYDSRWQFDDSNQTDLPIATTSLVSAQQDYQITSNHLSIDRVEVKDTAGLWHLLTQIDQQQFKGDNAQSLTDYLKTNGLPIEYDLVSNSIFLYPVPNYSQSASLKLYFSRPPASWSSADLSTGTAVPGFNSLFHDLVPLWVAFDYWNANNPTNARGFATSIITREKDLQDFYGSRNRDYKGRLTPNRDSTR